jgi:hypothetical protein
MRLFAIITEPLLTHPQMRFYMLFILIAHFLIMASCSGPENVPGFNNSRFKNDPDGCEGERMQMLDDILSAKNNLLGRNRFDLEKVIGKPDREELYEKGQRYYIYLLEPGPACDGTLNVEMPIMLYVRLSALDQVTEVSVKNI